MPLSGREPPSSAEFRVAKLQREPKVRACAYRRLAIKVTVYPFAAVA